MEGQLAIQQIGDLVLRLVEFDVGRSALAGGNVGVPSDVLAVHDFLDEAGVRGIVHFLRVGLDEAVAPPGEKAAAAEPAILGVGGGRVGGGVIAPGPPLMKVKTPKLFTVFAWIWSSRTSVPSASTVAVIPTSLLDGERDGTSSLVAST